MGADLLGMLEHCVLLAVIRLGPSDAYGMKIRQALVEALGKDIAIGSVYATLDRLEEKGYVSSTSTPPVGRERAGNARRFFRVQAAGTRAVRECETAISRVKALQPIGGVS